MQSQPGVQAAAPAGAMERFVWRMDRVAGVLSRSLERGRYLALTLLSAGYFAATCYRASRKLFWFDELFTYYVSGLPDIGSVWRALQAGADLNPPFFYVATRASAGLLGRTELGLRMPEIVGFWIACICIYAFIARRAGAAAGLAGFLFPIFTSVYYYAYEARPHGMVLGFAALALCCWDATHRDRTAWSRVGFFLALLAAISTHAYAVLLLVPFLVAELAEFADTRRIDWGRLLAMLGSVSGIVPSIVLMAVMKGFYNEALRAKMSALSMTYANHFGTAVPVFAAVIILALLPEKKSGRTPGGAESVPLREMMLCIAFTLLPLLVFALARAAKAPFFDRYSVSAVLGVGILVVLLAARRALTVTVLLGLMATLMSAEFVHFRSGNFIKEPSTSITIGTTSDSYDYLYSWILSQPGLPVLLIDDLYFLPIIHYAPPNVAARLVHMGFPDGDVNALGYEKLILICHAPGKAIRSQDVLTGRQSYLALVTTRSLWRMEDMVKAGAEITILRSANDVLLASVRFAGSASP